MARKYTFETYTKRLESLQKKIKDGSIEAITGAARFGTAVAKQLAPLDTGALIRNITWKKSKNAQAWIMQGNPGNENPNRRGEPFNYANAMRTGSGSMGAGTKLKGITNPWKKHIHTGDPDYLLKAARQVRYRLKKDIRLRTNKAIKSK